MRATFPPYNLGLREGNGSRMSMDEEQIAVRDRTWPITHCNVAFCVKVHATRDCIFLTNRLAIRNLSIVSNLSTIRFESVEYLLRLFAPISMIFLRVKERFDKRNSDALDVTCQFHGPRSYERSLTFNVQKSYDVDVEL